MSRKNNARDSTQTKSMQAYSFAKYLNPIILFMQTIWVEKKKHKRKCQSLYRKYVLDYKMHCQRLFSVLFAIQIFSIPQPTCTQIVLPKIYILRFQQTETEFILICQFSTYLGSLNTLLKSKQTHQNVSSTCCTGDKNASLKKFIQIFLGTKQFQN